MVSKNVSVVWVVAWAKLGVTMCHEWLLGSCLVSRLLTLCFGWLLWCFMWLLGSLYDVPVDCYSN